jgi:hypothetical protein
MMWQEHPVAPAAAVEEADYHLPGHRLGEENVVTAVRLVIFDPNARIRNPVVAEVVVGAGDRDKQ